MNEIKCPKCGTVFEIDEASYDSIVKQIRDREFDKEVNLREEQHKLDKENSIKLAEAHIKEELGLKLNEKDLEISELKLSLKTKEEQATNKVEKEYQEKLNKLLLEITELKNKIQLQESKNELDIEKAVSEKNQKISDLSSELALKGKEFELKENTIKESYESKLKAKDEQIAYYKDFKAKQSTKMIGESLEQHCSVEFNRLRPLFKNAYFEKDNDARTGSKGDFIFRDYDDEGNEIVSIMFEMKNEADKTATKHKNEDFLKELDKDRKEKKCEYAVLVSMLEADNELYNSGIVNVSHKYPKMYIVRPQFFLPIISLIRDGAYSSLNYKKELALVKSQDLDLEHFEDNLETFKSGFSANYERAKAKFTTAIDEIDKSIQHLQKIKDALQSSDNQLRLANNKVQDLTIKKITKNSPSIKEKLEEIRESKE